MEKRFIQFWKDTKVSDIIDFLEIYIDELKIENSVFCLSNYFFKTLRIKPDSSGLDAEVTEESRQAEYAFNLEKIVLIQAIFRGIHARMFYAILRSKRDKKKAAVQEGFGRSIFIGKAGYIFDQR